MYKRVIAALAALLLSADPSMAFMAEASFYGGGKGEKLSANTHSGLPFSWHNPYIVANNHYPFGKRFLVRYRGETQCVSVQDTGNMEKYGRKWDLSRAAAYHLGLTIKKGHDKMSFEETWCYIPPEYLPVKFNFGQGPS